jgi:hypothetical protein
MKGGICIPVMISFLVLFNCHFVVALEPGQASGHLIWNQQRIELSYAYGAIKARPDMPDTTDLYILLSDSPIPASVLNDEDKLGELERTGSVSTMMLVYCCDDDFKEMNQTYLKDGFADSGDVVTIKPLKRNGMIFEGTAFTPQPRSILKKTYEFNISFKVQAGNGSYGDNPFAAKSTGTKNTLQIGTAQGSVAINDEQLKFQHSYAVAYTNKDREKYYYVCLTSEPFNGEVPTKPGALRELLSKRSSWFLELEFSPEKTLRVVDLIKQDQQLNIYTNTVFIPVKFDDQSIQGELSSGGGHNQNANVGKYKLSLNAKFAQPGDPWASLKKGTRLPAGGGEPGKVYLASMNAIKTGNLSELMNLLSVEGRKKFQGLAPKDLKSLNALLETERTNVKLVDGYVNGKNAILFLEANGPYNGDIIFGSVNLELENNTWKFAGEKWD